MENKKMKKYMEIHQQTIQEMTNTDNKYNNRLKTIEATLKQAVKSQEFATIQEDLKKLTPKISKMEYQSKKTH